MKVSIYTDGACKGNPGPGGWGCYYLYDDGSAFEFYGGEENTTNNIMELKAAINGLINIKEDTTEITVYTDSKYVQQGITTWIEGWKAKNWKTSQNKPVKNVELWNELDALISLLGVKFEWVKGHGSDLNNHKADELANKGVMSIS